MFLEYFKRKKWLKMIKEKSNAALIQANEIRLLESQLLSLFANIAQKMDKKDDHSCSIFTLALKIFVEQPGKINRKLKPGDLSFVDLEKLVQAYVRSIVNNVNKKAKTNFPNGCYLDKKKADETVAKLLLLNLHQIDTNRKKIEDRLKQDITNDLSKYIIGYKKWLITKERMTINEANIIFDLLKKDLSYMLLQKCSLNDSEITQTILALLKKTGTVEIINRPQIIEQLKKDIANNPSRYISRYKSWIETLSKEIFNRFNKTNRNIGKYIPEECSLNVSACCGKICFLIEESEKNIIFEKQIDYQAFVNKFSEIIYKNPWDYIKGLEQIISRNASQLFSQIELHLSKSLPTGITLNKYACISAIEHLMKDGIPPSRLVEKFMRDLNNSPSIYLLRDDKYFYQDLLKSSNEYSSGGDHAMLSDG